MRFGKKVGSHIQALFNSTKPNIMTNKEKAYEISERYATSDYFPTDEEISAYETAMEMAEWKDQQAIEYLYKNIQSLLKDYGVSEASADIATQLFLANFKKAMKGGEE